MMKSKKGRSLHAVKFLSVEIDDPSECTSEEDLAHWVVDLLINTWLEERRGKRDELTQIKSA